MYEMLGKYDKMNNHMLVNYNGGEWEEPSHHDERGNQILFNGEIYNLPSLQKELQVKGIDSLNLDTEDVLLKYFMVYGLDKLLSVINGIFIFAIYDRERKNLYIVRDHMGIFPVYYYEFDKGILFSSEVKCFLKSGVAARLSYEGLFSYFANHSVDEPFTLVQGVKALSPGSFLTASGVGESRVHIYWDAALPS